jgi:N-methylhydantoinase A
MPGGLSALGILISDTVKDYSRTVMLPPGSAEIERHFRELAERASREFAAEKLKGTTTRSFDMRYVGQGYELNIPAGRTALSQFHAAHEKRYGYADPERPVEIVNVRLRMTAAADKVRFTRAPLRKGNANQAILKTVRVSFDERIVSAPLYQREQLRPGDSFAGPAIVAEYSATTVVPPGCVARVDAYRNLLIEVQ